MSSTLVLYRTAPQAERKAAKELRENRAKAYVPRDLSAGKRHPTARGYVFSDRAVSRVWTKHVGPAIGTVSSKEVGRLYIGRPPAPKTTRPFDVGDRVEILVGPFAKFKGTIVEDRGRVFRVDTELFGRCCTTTVHTQHLRKYDPG